MKEYVYRDKRTGEIYFSKKMVEDENLEFICAVEVKGFGRGRIFGTADSGYTEEEKEGNST